MEMERSFEQNLDEFMACLPYTTIRCLHFQRGSTRPLVNTIVRYWMDMRFHKNDSWYIIEYGKHRFHLYKDSVLKRNGSDRLEIAMIIEHDVYKVKVLKVDGYVRTDMSFVLDDPTLSDPILSAIQKKILRGPSAGGWPMVVHGAKYQAQIGPKGGAYYMKNGRRIYLQQMIGPIKERRLYTVSGFTQPMIELVGKWKALPLMEKNDKITDVVYLDDETDRMNAILRMEESGGNAKVRKITKAIVQEALFAVEIREEDRPDMYKEILENWVTMD